MVDLVQPFVKGEEILAQGFGFGGGEFLMEEARLRPEVPFVGIERRFKRVLKTARRLAKSPLENVRLIEAVGEEALPDRA